MLLNFHKYKFHMKALFLIPIISILFSCNTSTKNRTPLHDSIDTASSAVKIDSVQSIPQKVIDLKAEWDSINLHKISKESDTISFNSKDFKQINAELISEKVGNIRFNQIIMPDTNADGPFGKDIQYKLDKKGDYKLIIGESLMQGDPFDGDYILKFKGQ